MHTQTRMHTHSSTSTHACRIMSTWLCMVSGVAPSADAAVTAVWISNIQHWLTDWGRYSQAGAEGEGVRTCTHVKCVCLYIYVTARAVGVHSYNLWCVCMECENEWKKGEKMRGGIVKHVGWIRHFCLKKNWRSWRPDENLGVNKKGTVSHTGPPWAAPSYDKQWIRGHLLGNTRE